MKPLIKRWLRHERWKDSAFGDVFMRVYSPATARGRARELGFYRSLSPHPRKWNLVFDVGANAGSKALVFRKLAKKVICVEPDPTCFEMLKKRFASDASIAIVHAGASDRDGRALFSVLESGSPYNTFSEKWVAARMAASPASAKAEVSVEVTTLDSLIGRFGVPDYVKIDVEGHEEAVLQGLTRPVALLSFEANLPIFERETTACVRRLARLDPAGRFNYAVSDPPELFCLAAWVDGGAMIREIEKSGAPFMDIFWESRR